jgi:hypothetical protein
MAKKSEPQVKLPKQSNDSISKKNPSLTIKDFSVLLDVTSMMAERIKENNKNIKNLSSEIKDDFAKLQKNGLREVATKLDSLVKDQKTLMKDQKDLIKEQQISNKIAQQAKDDANFAEERALENEREKLLESAEVAELEKKDRAIIISKITALEDKDFVVNVDGKGSGGGFLSGLLNGLGGLLADLLKFGAIVGGLYLAFQKLKGLLDDIMSGEFFTDLKTRASDLAAALAGATSGARAAFNKASPKIQKGKENLKSGAKAAKEAVTGKRATAKASPKPATPGKKMSLMERAGRATRAVVETTKGAGRVAGGTAAGLQSAVSLKGLAGSAAMGGAVGGVASGAIEAATGGSAIDIAKAGASGAVQGAAISAGMRVAGGVAGTAGALVGGTAGRALTYSVPLLGWGLLAYDLIKTAYSSGEMGRNIASSRIMSELDEKYQASLQNAEAYTKEAEKYKESDPERYNRMIDQSNNLIKSAAKQMAQFMSIVETENALNEITKMNKDWQVGPFGLWDRGSNYTLNDIDNISKFIDKVDGKSTAEKIKNALENPDKYNVPGLKAVVENLGVEETAKLVLGAKDIIQQYREDIVKDPFKYFEEKANVKPPEQMKKGAALIHSVSPTGVPVMAGERGNPETIIPLNKFDQIISDYLNNKTVNLQLESKSYDGITNHIRDSYLEEKLQTAGGNNVTINNINNGKGGSASTSEGANFQFQTDLAKTFDNVFEMILEKNIRMGMA